MGSEPYWFLALAALCVLVVLYLIPDDFSRRLHDTLIDSPATKNVTALAALVGFAVVLFTALQIKLDLDDREAEREIRRDEAIDRAWSRLLARASGNTGKGGALSTLHREGISLNTIDLSCRAVGDWDFATERCQRFAVFGDVALAGRFETGKLTAAALDFSDGYLERPAFANAFLMHIGFDRAVVSMPDIRRTMISVGAGSSIWRDGAIVASTVTTLPGAAIRLERMDVSGSILDGLDTGAIAAADDDLYYWADWPPLEESAAGWNNAGRETRPALRRSLRERMQACRPPHREGSQSALPREERGSLSPYSCAKMSADEAAAAFPEAYRLSW